MDVLRELEQAGAVYVEKHFVYASGKHGPGYINMDPIFPNLELMDKICFELANSFRRPDEIDVVFGAATGGIVLAVLTAQALNLLRESEMPVRAVWADKRNGGFAFERAGFADALRGANAVGVEDLLNTGGSLGKCIGAALECGAEVYEAAAICNRGGVTAYDLGLNRLHCLASVSFDAFDPAVCPLCEEGLPIVTDIAHGHNFQLAYPDYRGGFTKLLS